MPNSTSWEKLYTPRASASSGSVIREILKLTQQPDIISFGGGLPAPKVFPIEKIKQACITVLEQQGEEALQYSITEGYIPLREMIARQNARNSFDISIDHILITSGSQQALDFVGRLFINPGDHVVIEAPTYLGALQAWNMYGAKYISIPVDEHGMIVDKLEQALKAGPKLIYVLPNFQNPSGSTLSLERRKKLVELADKYGVPIVEDDPYGQLRYEGEHIPTVIQLDGQMRGEKDGTYNGNVIYMSTYSKLLAPGLRLAWVIAPPEVIRKMVITKQSADLHTSTFNQMIAYQAGKDGFIDEHVKIIRATYKERRDVMLEMMDELFPSEVSYTRPEGGMFLWGVLPEDMDSTEVLKAAIEKKVAFVPGSAFYPDGGGENTMRINFSYSNPETIREGITRLGLVLKEMLSKKGK